MLRKIAVLASVLLALAGCSVLRDNPATSKAVTQYAVAKYLENSGEPVQRAESALRVVRDIRALSSGDSVTLEFLRLKVATEIAKLTDSPADRILATNLLDVISLEIATRIGEGVLSPDDTVQVSTFLDWIEQAIVLASPSVER